MPGGLIQLVAQGSQDIYLTGNPQITLFKVVYRRHTNYANEYIRVEFTTSPKLSTTNTTKINMTVERNGDLLHDSYLVFDLPTIFTDRLSSFKWIDNVAQRIVNFVEISIAGQRIDIQYGQWMNIWNEIILPEGKKKSYDKLIGNESIARPMIFHTEDSAIIPKIRLYLPFNFWFCSNPGLALPLIALQYTQVEFTIEFNPLNDLFTIGKNPALSPDEFFNSFCNNHGACDGNGDGNGGGNGDSECPEFIQSEENKELFQTLCDEGWNARNVFWRYINAGDKNLDCIWKSDVYLELNYIFLDTDERRRFAQVTHEYMITQTNRRLFTGLRGGTNIIDLELHHPTKEFVWVFQRQDVYKTNDWFNYTIVNKLSQYQEIQRIAYKNSYLESAQHDPHLSFLNDSRTEEFIQSIALRTKSSPNVYPEDFLNIMISAKIVFNGNDRFSEKDYKFFNALMAYKYHTNKTPDGVQIYPFAVDPENIHPTGTANMSALNKVELYTILKDTVQGMCDEYDLFFYYHSFNILRIMGGIGQVAYQSG